MNERDLTRVLTEHVADVRLPDEAVRHIRMAAKEEKPVKKKMTLAIALVTVMMLLASVAVAAGTGMFDMLSLTIGHTVLPGAEEIVQSGLAVAETEYATIHVRQAAYDGQSALIMAEAVPTGDSYLLLEETVCPEEDRIALLMPDAENAEQTIAEYAAENGLTMIIVTMRQSYPVDSMEITDWNGGKLTLVKSFNASEDVIPMTLTFSAFPYEQAANYDEVVSAAQVEISLTASMPLWQVSSEETFDLPDYGVRIDGMRITGTVLQSYWEVRYTVTDIDKVRNGGLRMDILAADGSQPPRGVLGVGGCGLAQHEGDELIWHGGFGASAEAPVQLTIRVRNDAGDAAEIPVTVK